MQGKGQRAENGLALGFDNKFIKNRVLSLFF